MASGRHIGAKGDTGRDPGGFVALPWTVLDCPAYANLSHPAKALLLEVARQFVRDNNGRLLLSYAYLVKRGWKSVDVITRAKRELLASGLIFETVMGHRPNKASWYAVTWRKLDRNSMYDEGATVSFTQGAYMANDLNSKSTREQLYEKWRGASVRKSRPLYDFPVRSQQNANLSPRHGVGAVPVEPCGGIGEVVAAPSGGAVEPSFTPVPTPSYGDHLDMPSYTCQVN